MDVVQVPANNWGCEQVWLGLFFEPRREYWSKIRVTGLTVDDVQEEKSDIPNILGSTVLESLDAEQVSTNVVQQLIIESGSGSRYQLVPEKDSDSSCTKKRKAVSQVFMDHYRIVSLDAEPMSASN